MHMIIYCSLFVIEKDWKQSKCHGRITGQINYILFIQRNAMKSCKKRMRVSVYSDVVRIPK